MLFYLAAMLAILRHRLLRKISRDCSLQQALLRRCVSASPRARAPILLGCFKRRLPCKCSALTRFVPPLPLVVQPPQPITNYPIGFSTRARRARRASPRASANLGPLSPLPAEQCDPLELHTDTAVRCACTCTRPPYCRRIVA